MKDIYTLYRDIVNEAVNPVVVEIGAADGGDTEKLALGLAATGKETRLLAFECEVKNIPAIKAKHIAGLELFEMAVGDICGFVPFIGSGSWAYSGSLKEPKLHRISHAWIPFQPPVQVPCVTLDSVFDSCRLDHIDFIWMDVQGAEDLVIAGGQKALCSTRYIYSEIYEAEEYTGQIGRKEILKRLPGNWEIVADWGGDALFKNLFL